MITDCNDRAAIRRRPRGFSGMLRVLDRLLARQRSRTALRKLDARLLADIGLRETEAAEEARKRLWDVPDHWRAL